MPQVSVIVPVYAVERYLPRCIESILSQTFSDFELILVDDGSPDNCGVICDKYAARDLRVRVIHQKNDGLSRARNAALDVAQGTYVAFCDSDDYWHPEYLKQTYTVMVHEMTDMVVVNYNTVDERGHILRTPERVDRVVYCEGDKERIDYITKDLLDKEHEAAVWMRLYKRKIISDNNIKFCEKCGDYAEDLCFTLEYVLHSCKINFIQAPLYFYLQRSDSIMQKSKDMIKVDQLNEVSYQVYQRFIRKYQSSDIKRMYPVIHFLLLYTELRKVIGSSVYSEIGRIMKTIQKNKWCRKQLGGIFGCGSHLVKLFGKRQAQQIVLFTHYCRHGNWNRFGYESAIAYKFFISKR